MHLQENSFTRNVAQNPLHHVTYSATKFEVATSKGLRRCIYKKIQYLTFDLAQYPLHHVTYSATKFEVAMSNRLGVDTFTRKYII